MSERIKMKMAVANLADMDAALGVCNILDSLAQGFLPASLADPNDPASESYEKRRDAGRVVDHLLETAAKGSMFRVCFGMTVVLDPRNEVVDPAADTLEIHPKYARLAAANDAMLAALRDIQAALANPGVARDAIAQMAEAAIVSTPDHRQVKSASSASGDRGSMRSTGDGVLPTA